MAKLMVTLGNFSQEEELYNELFESATNDSDRALIYHCLGYLEGKQSENPETEILREIPSN